ncbi:MAG: hypothetical protein M1837_000479 [Sclerophora amabilis]|nr:MAG: hypothetical protein M1837_000479 [Sclerophora amabilis]
MEPLNSSSVQSSEMDEEIARVRAQIKSMTRRRLVLASTLMSSPATGSALNGVHRPQRVSAAQSNRANETENSTRRVRAISDRSERQSKVMQQNLYRMCAGATMFEVKDPNPCSVDDGRVLGVRIEAFIEGTWFRAMLCGLMNHLTDTEQGRFESPYYLFLNRTSMQSNHLRVHKHTIPACIPLPSLVAKYLPTPSKTSADSPRKSSRAQNLPRLVRELRRELVAYHMRKASIQQLSRMFSIGTDQNHAQQLDGKGIKAISTTDAEARDIRLEWNDGRTGRLRISKYGDAQECVVVGVERRDREMERKILGGNRRIEELPQRLKK